MYSKNWSVRNVSSSQHHNNEFSMTIKTNFELPLHKLHIALTLQTSVMTTNIASYLHCGPPVMRPHDSLRRQGLAITDQAGCTVYFYNFLYIYGTVSAKIAPRLKCYKNASRLNRYNFPTDNAIDFLFSTLHIEMV